MATISTHLGLHVDTTADQFSTAEVASNWGLIDAYPGVYLCTSQTRPAWGAPQTGMHIFEMDTALAWWWDGGEFHRLGPSGWLNGSVRTTDYQTNQQTAQVMVQCSADVPQGSRPIKVSVSWGLAEADSGKLKLSIWRDASQLQEWDQRGQAGATAALDQGEGGSVIIFDRNVSAVQHVYSFRCRTTSTFGGTAYVRSPGASQPITIDVEEG